MACPYESYRFAYAADAKRWDDDELLRRLAKITPDWECGPRLWTIWRTALKKEAAKRGLGT